MTSRRVSIEQTKKKLFDRLAAELGEEVPTLDTEAPYVTVTFTEKRPSYVLPILALLQEHAQGIATVSHNLGRR